MSSPGPIIQPRSVNQKNGAPGCRLNAYRVSLPIWARQPACVCTVPLGRPVVPLV